MKVNSEYEEIKKVTVTRMKVAGSKGICYLKNEKLCIY